MKTEGGGRGEVVVGSNWKREKRGVSIPARWGREKGGWVMVNYCNTLPPSPQGEKIYCLEEVASFFLRKVEDISEEP